MIKYFTKYKEQFRASGGPSKPLLRLDMPSSQLPTMWLQGKVWVPKGPGRWTGQQALLEAIGTTAGEACWWQLDSSS